MPLKFSRIALMGRYSTRSARHTLESLIRYLSTLPLELCLDAETADMVDAPQLPRINREDLGESCDLVIVVGGDGSLLNAARAVADHNVPVIGINRGTLGFLTDISPDDFEPAISAILQGHYTEERRFLLTAFIQSGDNTMTLIGDALNDVVLYAGEIARMIEFELTIDGNFVYSQRSDGMIMATPTGSTAYALSGGGPILHPSLDAIVLVPMFPHTLTSRPIVINSSSLIELRVAQGKSEIHPGVSCDGQPLVSLAPGAKLQVKRKANPLRLIHPLDHDYYQTLRSKLEWGSKLQNKHFPEGES
jgi:NAD+ kinase